MAQLQINNQYSAEELKPAPAQDVNRSSLGVTQLPQADLSGMQRHLADVAPALGIPSNSLIGPQSRAGNGLLNLDLNSVSTLNNWGKFNTPSEDYGERSAIRDAAREAAIKGLSDEQRKQLNEERRRYDYYNTTNDMIHITPQMREPGPLMQKVEADAKKIEAEARKAAFDSLTPEELKNLRSERIDSELQGKDPTSGPLANDFERRVLAEIAERNRSTSPEVLEVTSQVNSRDKLLQDLLKLMAPGLNRAVEAKGLIETAEKVTEALKMALELKSKETVSSDELRELADKLEAFANKTNNSKILEVVQNMRQLQVLGSDFSDPRVKEIGANLFGQLSTVDTEIKFALRESNRGIVKMVVAREMEFVGKEAYQTVLEGRERPAPYDASAQRQNVNKKLEEMNLL